MDGFVCLFWATKNTANPKGNSAEAKRGHSTVQCSKSAFGRHTLAVDANIHNSLRKILFEDIYVAFVRERKKEVDIDFTVEQIWNALPKAVDEFDWDIEEEDTINHILKIKTSKTLYSYGSTLRVELKPLNQKTTRMTVYGETPVATITSTLSSVKQLMLLTILCWLWLT
jgi:hypothetical protein